MIPCAKPQFDAHTPHNSGADDYPYRVGTAFFTDPELFRGRAIVSSLAGSTFPPARLAVCGRRFSTPAAS